MGSPRENREKPFLFSALLFTDRDRYTQAVSRLSAEYGKPLLESPAVSWTHSTHYADELGPGIQRSFVLFDHVLSPETIVDIKLRTNEIERVLSVNGKRTVNIDPGYLTLAKVVLATTKNYSHRIYMGKGIYAELALYYRDGAFHPLPFAYEDYKNKEAIEFLTTGRDLIQ